MEICRMEGMEWPNLSDFIEEETEAPQNSSIYSTDIYQEPIMCQVLGQCFAKILLHNTSPQNSEA